MSPLLPAALQRGDIIGLVGHLKDKFILCLEIHHLGILHDIVLKPMQSRNHLRFNEYAGILLGQLFGVGLDMFVMVLLKFGQAGMEFFNVIRLKRITI